MRTIADDNRGDTLRVTGILQVSLFILRVAAGWHFLYEGIVKLLDPKWTSAGFLVESRWIFQGVFHWIAASPTVLKTVDLLNIWGLIFIGLGLFFGCLTRLASVSGAVLLLLYYLAIPPIPSIIDSAGVEGNYLIVNKNLVELIMLVTLALLPAGRYYGIDGFFSTLRKRAATGDEENGLEPSGKIFPRTVDRRDVLKALAALPVFGVFAAAMVRRHGFRSFEEKRLLEKVGGNVNAITSATMRTRRFSDLKDLKGQTPRGKIGSLEISRLICGGNLISGFAHSRDLIYVSPLLKQYFSDEKVIDTLHICEACGINTAILRTDFDTIRILDKYRSRGGKIQWIAQTYPSEEDALANVKIALDNGAVGAFVQGNLADGFVRKDRMDIIEKAVSYIKSRGIVAGVAGHQLAVPVAVEKAGINPDFYMKTLHRKDYWSYQTGDHPVDVIDNKLDNYWCLDPDETVEYMKKITRPWIAYKVLAAGAISPMDGFRFTFQSGADFACVGMFDFQVIDNANTIRTVLKGFLPRTRPWMA